MEDSSSRTSSAKPPVTTKSLASSDIYDPLDRSKTEIRLAIGDFDSIQAGSGIALSLKVSDLHSEDLPKYNALPYQWNPPELQDIS